MRKPFAATSWELEAARRREVVASDFGAASEHHESGVANGHTAKVRVPIWVSRLASAVADSPVDQREDAARRHEAVGVVRPGS